MTSWQHPETALREDGIQAIDGETAEDEVLQLPEYKELTGPLEHNTCFENLAEGIEACANFIIPQQVFYQRTQENYAHLNVHGVGGNVRWFDLPIFECNSSSPCEQTKCSQRVVQHNKCPPLLVVLTGVPAKGKGLVSSIPLKEGRFVIRYAGEIVSDSEALRRRERQEEDKHENTYLLTMCEHSQETGRSYHIHVDAKKSGNCARYINHSCGPNLIPMCVRSETMLPTVAFFALKDIPACTELTFDYAYRSSAETLDTPPLSSTPCHCGSAECRKYLPKSDPR